MNPGNTPKARKNMTKDMETILKHLRLWGLLERWDEVIAEARKKRFSPERLLQHVLESEYRTKSENARILRRKRARIPEPLEIETYPFQRQPKLDRKKIMSLYDGLDYMEKNQNIILLGPTGCGKTGLATSFLLHAIDQGYRGYFTSFANLVAELYASMADRSEDKVIRKYVAYDCLVIDEVGYIEVEATQVGLFFTLMQKRHKNKPTLLTSNLGFSEWSSFLKNKHLTAALIDRLTENSHVINMKNCKTLRGKLDDQVKPEDPEPSDDAASEPPEDADSEPSEDDESE
jgi:DNA replication protein DnaC